MVNIARVLFGIDKTPEKTEEKSQPVEEKTDPRLLRTSKFVRPVKKKLEPKEVEPEEVEQDAE